MTKPISNTSPMSGIAEEIRKALDQAERLPSYQDHVKSNAERWLRKLLEERVELWACPDCGFAFDTDHKDVQGGGHSCPHCAEIELGEQLQQLREELEQVKKERDRLRLALEDVADYQHRWSDSPIIEVQKIARSILSKYTKED